MRDSLVVCRQDLQVQLIMNPNHQSSSRLTFQDESEYLKRKFREDVTSGETGLSSDELQAAIVDIDKQRDISEPWAIGKAKLFEFLCDNIAIEIDEYDWFPAFSIWNRNKRPLSPVLNRHKDYVNKKYNPELLEEIAICRKEGIATNWQDFEHSVPDWDVIIPLGFPGLKARFEKYRKETPYYIGIGIAADASMRLVKRLADRANERLLRDGADWTAERRKRIEKEADCLENLCKRAPQTAYEVMMFIYLYWYFTEHIDHIQVRSLSNIDRILTPYYDNDIALGVTTEKEFREHFRHFIWQWGSIDNYWGQPVFMGGTKIDGTTEYNHLSKIILDVVDEEALPTPKFQLKIADNTPEWLLDKTLDMVRRHRSLVFCGEKGMTKAMKRFGATDEQCRTMTIFGCYEFTYRDSANTTGTTHLNFLKQVELLLSDAVRGEFQAQSWDDFKKAYLKRLSQATTRTVEISIEREKHLDEINPASLYSLATEYSLKNGIDAFACGTEFGNNTLIMLTGLGTTVDALLAVKELVYENKELTLKALGELMANNWNGRSDLQSRILRSSSKWGNNGDDANLLGAEIIKTFSSRINGKANGRNGIFLASGHCAKQFTEQGKLTGATPDGRLAKEEMSKNLSPTMGMDTEGVTALLNTISNLDSSDLPGDFPLDVMLLPKTVEGEAGLVLLKTILKVYFNNDGCAIHFNIFDSKMYRDAQKHPENYENLQVRVCGWNVRWNDIPLVEQEKYLARAEGISQ